MNGSYEGDGGYDDEDLFGRDDDPFADMDMEASLEEPQSGYQDGEAAAAPPAPTEEPMGNEELARLMNEGIGEETAGINLADLNEMELDFGGEKDETAVDYADIDDDDLAEEEEQMGGPVQPPSAEFLHGTEESAEEPDLNDLFGEDEEPADVSFATAPLDDGKSEVAHKDDADSVASDQPAPEAGLLAALGARDENMTEEDQRNLRLQMALLRGEDQGPRRQYGTLEIDDMDSWLQIEFPNYDRDDDAPFWNKLIPMRPGTWKGKEPKKARPIRPTKVTLDIEPDQKTLFTAPTAVAAPFEPRTDLIHLHTGKRDEAVETLSDSGSEDNLPNGLSMQELEFMCTDIDTLSHLAEEDLVIPEPRIVGEDVDMLDMEDEFNDFERPVKKRRTGLSAHDIVTIHQFELPTFDNPEKMTAKLSHEVVLDLNDSQLLVEELDQETQRQRSRPGNSAAQLISVKERLARRFKTSNDAAYNLLQQNQKKVRGQLSNMTIDHSVPAIKLQYPYYQVKMTQRDMRNWHRKQILFKSGFAFSKINKQKRKDFKTKSIREAYNKTRDLSVADNSYALLLEYSEEHPIMLSQAGMGNKVVNYYRKSDSNDTSRPRSEIGDTSVLMPEDKSPFNNFGHIDPGESTLALYNSMYRAPIFKQGQSSQDFLIVREVTGMNGQIHYLRNIDYQYVVGQELPSVTVPGTHSRMVTTASKNRLKAISFRIARRKKSHRIRVEEVTRHFPDTNDMQNRQKMKEFMAFNKEQKEWEMRDGAGIPDEEEIQKTLKPEDICLLESMQVGSQYLRDSGFAEDEDADDDKDDDDKKDLSIEQQLAPWKTTKNFIQATQGKAMLRLYGEGDPSGRGEAFSFIKTSMKGGFKAQGLSINENVGKKGDGGHTYNVAKQQQLYDDSIRTIWDKQKAVLSSQVEPEDIEDEGVDAQLDQAERARNVRATPMSGMQTPIGRRRDDETGTSFSKRSGTSQAQKFLKIRRKVWNSREEEYEYKEVVESDPQVIKLYLKRKEQMEASSTRYVTRTIDMPVLTDICSLHDLVPTGDPEVDARHKKRLEAELARLEQTKQKRPRKKKGQVAVADAGSPGAGSPDADGNDPSTPVPVSGGRQTQATARKCANCGRVGHIKTNKKSVSSRCKYCGFDMLRKVQDAHLAMSLEVH